MKLLPCENCRTHAVVKVGSHEEALVVGRVRRFPYRYRCSRCKKLTTLQAAAYNRLPELTDRELIELGFGVPAGTTPAEAER